MAGQQSLSPSCYRSYWERSALITPWMWTVPTAAQKDGKPRAIIARLHCFQVKELVLRLTRERALLQYDGRPVFNFPDLTSATMKKRMPHWLNSPPELHLLVAPGWLTSSPCTSSTQYVSIVSVLQVPHILCLFVCLLVWSSSVFRVFFPNGMCFQVGDSVWVLTNFLLLF